MDQSIDWCKRVCCPPGPGCCETHTHKRREEEEEKKKHGPTPKSHNTKHIHTHTLYTLLLPPFFFIFLSLFLVASQSKQMLYSELHNGSLFHFFLSSFFHVLIRLHMFCINSTSASSMSPSIYLHYRFLLLLFLKVTTTSIRAFLGEGYVQRKGREGREREEMKAPIGS